MIRYSSKEGFIKPKGIKLKEGIDKNFQLPKEELNDTVIRLHLKWKRIIKIRLYACF